MNLRPELLPPLVEEQRVEELRREIERIETLIYRGEPVDEAVTAFNQRTGHRYHPSDFTDIQASRSLEDFAIEAARPYHPRVPDIAREELVEIVRRVMAADSDSDYYLRLLDANVSHPAITDLIFHPPTELTDACAEQIVDVALTYQPIAL